jgi:hypothetical protein
MATAPLFITGQITASGGLLPAEAIRPAPGQLGAVTITNASASNTATLTAPGSGGFVLPAGATVSLILGGVRLTVTGTSPAVSYAYATNGG